MAELSGDGDEASSLSRVPFVDVDGLILRQDVLDLVSAEDARSLQILPLKCEGGRLWIANASGNIPEIPSLANQQLHVFPLRCDASKLQEMILRHYP